MSVGMNVTLCVVCCPPPISSARVLNTLCVMIVPLLSHAHPRARYTSGVFWVDAGSADALDRSFHLMAVTDLGMVQFRDLNVDQGAVQQAVVGTAQAVLLSPQCMMPRAGRLLLLCLCTHIRCAVLPIHGPRSVCVCPAVPLAVHQQGLAACGGQRHDGEP